jgi:three-Cys-motif partner protein
VASGLSPRNSLRRSATAVLRLLLRPGRDSNNAPGSPLILLEELLAVRPLIERRRHEVRILFNDRSHEKIVTLRGLCAEQNVPWQPRFESQEFGDVFAKVQNEFDNGPTLVFVDQNGMKHMTRATFDVLTEASLTDFLFFTASSFKRRFGDLLAPEIEVPANVSYLEAHRALADQYREWAPKNVLIGHFAIKKGPNIYGLVFGSHHWRGLQKFLDIAWKLDRECGEANYELESREVQGEMNFESGSTVFRKKKVEAFRNRLDQFIKLREQKSDQDVFLYCLTNGFLPRVAKDVYERMRRDGFLKNDRKNFPRYSDVVMKEPRTLII